MRKRMYELAKTRRGLKKEKAHKRSVYGLFGVPGAIRTRGLSLRSFDERLQRRIMASHLLLKTPYVMGILEIEFHTQSHAIP